jgi:L-galactose dehydrogenase
VGIINASALCMGLLTPQGPPAWHPAPPPLRAAAAAARDLCASRGCSLSKLALADAFRNRDISTTLVGFCTAEQVRENVETALQALGLLPNPQAEVEGATLRDLEAIFEPVMGVTWPSGRPENSVEGR